METFHTMENEIPENTWREYLASKEFKENLVSHNIRKGKLLAVIVISLESVIASIAIISFLLKVNNTFLYSVYLAMYLLMITANIGYLLLIGRYQRGKMRIDTMYLFNILYITMIMVWGSMISLMDQKLYGQIMVYMVNMIVCSILYYLDKKAMIIPYLVSTVLLIVALPFFQTSVNILIGHYVNVAIFVTISWTISRIIYRSHCSNYVVNRAMQQANLLLEKEIQKNTTMNMRLSIANAQLTELALVDDLTKLPNRRGFRAFIDHRISNFSEAQQVSVIMIDIDYFKQYNDLYGHENGDKALVAVADSLKESLNSPNHIAVRWGGEEFIYAAFDTSQEDIILIANAIRKRILDLKIPNHSSTTNPYLTISMGTCTANPSETNDIEAFIQRADAALYVAKKHGRNSVATSFPDEIVLCEDEADPS